MKHGGRTRGYPVRANRGSPGPTDGGAGPAICESVVETYSLDIDPEQVARWVMAERDIAPASFRVTARRSREVREIPLRKETHLGDQEREDLSEIATVATLEIAPMHTSDGWTISIVVEDELGPRVSNALTNDETEQPIDPGHFFKEFIRTGRGNAAVIAEAQDGAAMERVRLLLRTIEAGRHAPSARAKHR